MLNGFGKFPETEKYVQMNLEDENKLGNEEKSKVHFLQLLSMSRIQ